jgi:hypothetical protein
VTNLVILTDLSRVLIGGLVVQAFDAIQLVQEGALPAALQIRASVGKTHLIQQFSVDRQASLFFN